MSIDLSQFIATFMEESYEGLEVMESSLLNLDSADEETINTIFRAAHSIKGGAGTFGFSEVADFTHVVETLLDELRSGKQSITPPLVNLLLESVDCMKMLLEATQEGPEADADVIAQVRQRLEQALGAEGWLKPLTRRRCRSKHPTGHPVRGTGRLSSCPMLTCYRRAMNRSLCSRLWPNLAVWRCR